MKIAHLDTGRSWRGGQAQVLHLVHGSIERGHSCSLLATEPSLLERAATAGATVERWSARGDLDGAAVLRARAALRRLAPDLVHGHTAGAHVAAVYGGRACGAHVVVARRVLAPVATHALSRWKYRLPVDRYLCVSAAVEEAMRGSGIAAEKLRVIPSGVVLAAPDRSKAPDLRDTLRVAAGTPIVGTVGALTAEKGAEVWLEAIQTVAAEHPDVQWVWIGEGRARAAHEARRDQRGLQGRVHFLGFREQVRALMSQFTVFLLPTLQEGLGTSILDAQALGVPVIASRVGGIREIVTHDATGCLVPPDDPASLAAAMHRTLTDADARARWAAAAAEQVRGFGVDAMVERTLEAYREVIETSASAGE